jgi:hypothetical protein
MTALSHGMNEPTWARNTSTPTCFRYTLFPAEHKHHSSINKCQVLIPSVDTALDMYVVLEEEITLRAV